MKTLRIWQRVCLANKSSLRRVSLCVDDPVLEIDFRHGNLAQRSMDEGAFLAMVAEASGPVGPVVTVTGSDFLDWFHQQSCGIYSLDEVKHVAILTQNEWVEVLCLELPTVRKLDSAVSDC